KISSTTTFHGHVREISTRRIRISIPLKNLNAGVFDGQKWTVDRFPSDVTAEASHTALYDFLVSPADEKKRTILGIAAAEDTSRTPVQLVAGLNRSQSEAVERAANCTVMHLIWGPPGTGKTKVIPEIVHRVRGPVLLGAFTNTAVDKMLLAL